MMIGLGQGGRSVAEILEAKAEWKRVEKKNAMFQLKEYRKVICAKTSFCLGQK